MNLPTLIDHLDHFQRRVVQEAMKDATAAYWNRRAATFEAARPRPGDYSGRATRQQIAEQDARLAALARACSARADLLTEGEVAA